MKQYLIKYLESVAKGCGVIGYSWQPKRFVDLKYWAKYWTILIAIFFTLLVALVAFTLLFAILNLCVMMPGKMMIIAAVFLFPAFAAWMMERK